MGYSAISQVGSTLGLVVRLNSKNVTNPNPTLSLIRSEMSTKPWFTRSDLGRIGRMIMNCQSLCEILPMSILLEYFSRHLHPSGSIGVFDFSHNNFVGPKSTVKEREINFSCRSSCNFDIFLLFYNTSCFLVSFVCIDAYRLMFHMQQRQKQVLPILVICILPNWV